MVDNTINRFKDFENLKFLELFLVRKFKEYEKFFPDVLFNSLQSSYGMKFDFIKLKSELIELIVTIPVTRASVERSFSTMKRIKTFSRSTQTEERLSALALISIEKKNF